MTDFQKSYIPTDNSALQPPLYRATFRQAVSRWFRKYATFTGRASRSEYWWVALVNAIVVTVLALPAVIFAASTGSAFGQGLIGALLQLLLIVYSLGTLIPTIAVSMRRLHDANFSGWMVLLALIPTVGAIVVAVLALQPSKPEGARFDKP